MTRIVVVAPLKEGARETARLLLEDGPPFDPSRTRLTGHHVHLTETEVIFAFEGPDVRGIVESLIGEASVLQAATAWRECLSGRPRIAEEIYRWERGAETTGEKVGETG
jgi:hypothetical protein